jgi:hypothetical protein
MKNAAILMVLSVLLLSAAAKAELVTIQIEGLVDSVSDSGDYLDGLISPGDLITGFYTYDTATQDTSSEVWLGHYEYSTSPHGIVLDIGTLRFQTDFTNVNFTIGISNNRPSPVGDIYNLASYHNLPMPSGADVQRIYWQLNDSSGQALQNTDLTNLSPVLSGWQDGNILCIEGGPAKTGFTVATHVTNAYVIPEPSSIVFFSLGMLFYRNKK